METLLGSRFLLLLLLQLLTVPSALSEDERGGPDGRSRGAPRSPIVVYDAGETLPDGRALSYRPVSPFSYPRARPSPPREEGPRGKLYRDAEDGEGYPESRGRGFYRGGASSREIYPDSENRLENPERGVIFFRNPKVADQPSKQRIYSEVESGSVPHGTTYPNPAGQVIYPESAKRVVYRNPAGQAIYPESAKRVVYPNPAGEFIYPESAKRVVYPNPAGEVIYPESAKRVVYRNPAGQVIYPESAKRVVYPNPAGQVIYPESAKRVVYPNHPNGVRSQEGDDRATYHNPEGRILYRQTAKRPIYPVDPNSLSYENDGRRSYQEEGGEGPIRARYRGPLSEASAGGRPYPEEENRIAYVEDVTKKARPWGGRRVFLHPERAGAEIERNREHFPGRHLPAPLGRVGYPSEGEERGEILRWRGQEIPTRHVEGSPTRVRGSSALHGAEDGGGVGRERKGEGEERRWDAEEKEGERKRGRGTDVPTDGDSKKTTEGEKPLPAFIRDSVDAFVFGKSPQASREHQ